MLRRLGASSVTIVLVNAIRDWVYYYVKSLSWKNMIALATQNAANLSEAEHLSLMNANSSSGVAK